MSLWQCLVVSLVTLPSEECSSLGVFLPQVILGVTLVVDTIVKESTMFGYVALFAIAVAG